MPLSLRVSDGTELPLATNAGWGSVGRWMEQQPNSPLMHQLYRDGWAEPASELLEELQAANDLNPPLNMDCAKTVLELIDTLDSLDDDEAVVVTDGMGSA